MKRFLKTIMWQLILALTITVVYVVINKEDVAKRELVGAIRKLIGKTDDSSIAVQITPEDVKAGNNKLQKLKHDYPSPKSLFKQVKDNYQFSTYLLGGEKNKSSSWVSSESTMNNKSIKIHYPKRSLILPEKGEFSVKLNDGSGERINYRFNCNVGQLEYLPLKGDFGCEFFCMKIDSDSKAKYLNIDRKFTFKHLFSYVDKTRHMGAGSSNNNNKRDELSRTLYRKVFCFESAGLYAIQYHLYPDELMAKSINGIIKSPIYYIRVEEN